MNQFATKFDNVEILTFLLDSVIWGIDYLNTLVNICITSSMGLMSYMLAPTLINYPFIVTDSLFKYSHAQAF